MRALKNAKAFTEIRAKLGNICHTARALRHPSEKIPLKSWKGGKGESGRARRLSQTKRGREGEE